ncbi:hypothetical protein ESA94_15440 [Lacibacter luteus]|uniref:DUF4595 domain-containing protein n=1 Tax=Lacibacter luteus TaxID=2508719 RepID=A0A4Q1CFJ2_9BACT|nr:hypothetical protein [Lacibacter luteus]RXK58782.1 hypothetical protein ESA94_15440 [Lacibacter luteus]
MKKLLFIAAIALLSSCKKEKTEGPSEQTPLFTKNLISVTAPGMSEWAMFYSNDRKLMSFTNTDMKVSYKPGIPFSAKKAASGFLHEYQNAVQDAQGRVTKLDRYNSGGLTATQEFKYSAEGYLVEQTIKANSSNSFAKYVYEYQAGNLTTMSAYEGGMKTAMFVFEYYTNQYNPIQIDLFDFKGVQFVTDAQFGKQSKNLLKNAKMLAPDGQVFFSIDLSYTTDADGYIKTISRSSGGQSSTVYTCTFQ